ncbi:tRNA uridine-5-carboxymethylaminomethyl(34) synthesis GTPase MnmE [Limisalsivibrio acetivorans]|uniref:tRNA uridine-5-carboxymethylaminomethyl(34) synthesis GTPase MnmE n=1 Tax=Limisalsivibrio acetivorans TaxID=1304888 RepID=UPI0003B4D362|nr:tRNA uridine-5-carboxymethylaminomethyl(34) synthesis GTPase MnmE [Limisalsivibrio acetivorans]
MDTIAAPITPVVRSAVIVIRVSGPEALSVLRFLYTRNGERIESPKPRQAVYAIFEDGKLRDDILFTYFKAPYSYTGEDVLEISFHGNPLIAKHALSSMQSIGIRYAEPGEFTKQAFINGKLDLSQAEAVQELICTKSEDGLFYSYNQLKGGLRERIENLRDLFIDVLTVVEAYVDFPEEDLSDKELSYIEGKYAEINETLRKLIRSYEITKTLNDTHAIAIVGKPNVGKSSLLNYMVRENRALVSDIPGTTRDFIDAELYIGGVPVRLVDTAGIRFTDDLLEKQGIERSRQRMEEAEIVLVLLDLSRPLDDEDNNLLELTNDMNRVIVGSKSDNAEYEHDSIINISIKTDDNMEKLFDILEAELSGKDSAKYEADIAVNERQRNSFQYILDKISELDISQYHDLDILAFELRDCLGKIEEITGEGYTEDILNNIFSNFCIGK